KIRDLILQLSKSSIYSTKPREACNAATDYWFNSLNKTVLRAPKAALNNRSKRISESSGMRLIRTEKKAYVSGILDSELWEITRDEWNARKGG
ncbi:GNAT family N-acetyltransferase, partial [Klebsiella pneumoniae]|uniref:GNAT family N-acetyltransferase n=1 Tax=Klebsiella pneumoniae TaxID=573 RepID=UPI00405582B1